MTVIKTNRWDAQRERLSRMEGSHFAPDMAEQPYDQPAPKRHWIAHAVTVATGSIIVGMLIWAFISGDQPTNFGGM